MGPFIVKTMAMFLSAFFPCQESDFRYKYFILQGLI